MFSEKYKKTQITKIEMLVAPLMGQIGKSWKRENKSNKWILEYGKSHFEMGFSLSQNPFI